MIGLALIVAIAAFFLKSWVVMLLIGAAHHEVHEAIPALGYVPTLWIVALVSVLIAGSAPAK